MEGFLDELGFFSDTKHWCECARSALSFLPPPLIGTVPEKQAKHVPRAAKDLTTLVAILEPADKANVIHLQVHTQHTHTYTQRVCHASMR